jgi:ABC-type iron transport system FetAB permease component
MKSQGIKFILVGFVLVVFGAVAPFMMVLDMLTNDFWLSIVAYSASVIGLFIGVFGAIEISEENLNK